MKVHLDPERCDGHMLCVPLAPQIFQLNDDGYVSVVNEDVPAGSEEKVREAVRMCPERAIAVL